MRAEDLKIWLAAAQRGEKKGETAEKEGVDRQDTGEGAETWGRLVELMWKVVAVILNRRFTSSITFHDVLHGFGAGRVLQIVAKSSHWRTTTSTTTLKMVGESGSPCVTPRPPLEPLPVVPPCPRYHRFPLPVYRQKPPYPISHSVSF